MKTPERTYESFKLVARPAQKPQDYYRTSLMYYGRSCLREHSGNSAEPLHLCGLLNEGDYEIKHVFNKTYLTRMAHFALVGLRSRPGLAVYFLFEVIPQRFFMLVSFS